MTDQQQHVQAALPDLELPEYHGQKPDNSKSVVSGMNDRLHLNGAHRRGTKIVAVVELLVDKVGHEEDDDGVTYYEKMKALSVFEVAYEPGRRLLSAMRSAYRSEEDERKGRTPLADDDEDFSVAGVTDASGVALTPSEVAALRGRGAPDPIRAMLDESASAVLIVWSDGARDLWPDDFEPETERPKIGERFESDAGDEAHVAKILHATTGETLEEWTEEDEDRRLEELEAKLESEEKIGEAIGEPAEEVEELEGDEDEALAELGFDGDPIPPFDDDLPPLDEDVEPFTSDEVEESFVVEAEIVDDDEPVIPQPFDADFETIEGTVEEVKAVVDSIDQDEEGFAELRRILEAERRGRRRDGGRRHLNARGSLLEHIEKRIRETEAVH